MAQSAIASKVEQFGLEAVPKELRSTSWFDYFIIQLSFSVNAGNFLLPALAVMEGGLSFFQAVLCTVIGASLAFFFVSLLSLPGSVHGIPAQYAIRSFIGTKGARFFSSPVRTITSLYWFCVQTIGGTLMIIEICRRYFQIELEFAPLAMLLGSGMAAIAAAGFDAVKKITKYFLPFLLAGQGVIFYLYFTTRSAAPSASNMPIDSNSALLTMALYASLVFVQYISGVSASADMARYAKSPKHGFFGLYAGNFFGFFLTACFGAYSALYYNQLNPFISASTLTDSIPVVMVILICSILSMFSINLNNAYTGAFSLLNIFPALGRLKSAAVFGIAAICLSTIPAFVTEASYFISLMGSAIIPLSAVIVVEFVMNHFKTAQISSKQINGRAAVAIICGICIYFIIPDRFSPGFFTFIFSGLLCLILIKTEKSHHD
ncbi:cytosine permease [Metabacillus idriensis]|uniref:cytosine permease n=1 Tax=Metabacillus idriensis TaxID=324768 RepID=UPI00281443EA|nr:cytosine permease [Metabacillus idriensis]MDR0138070.1 cytosine permease [Metabacillus idriensis]